MAERDQVLDAIRMFKSGLTANEIAAMAKMAVASVLDRLGELQKQTLVRDSGVMRGIPKSLVWVPL